MRINKFLFVAVILFINLQIITADETPDIKTEPVKTEPPANTEKHGNIKKCDPAKIINGKCREIPWQSAVEQSLKFKKQYKARKAVAVTFIALGAISIVTGFGFTGAFGGEGAFIGVPLMFGGLTLVSSGLTISSSANYRLKVSEAFNRMSGNYYDPDVSATEYYKASGTQMSVMKEASGDIRVKGILLTSFSASLFAISAGCIGAAFAGSDKSQKNSDESENNDGTVAEAMGEGLESALLLMVGISGAISGTILLSEGIALLSISSKWSRLNPKAGIVTLNSIAPVIDPVSKTYGLSMGFSF